MEQYRTMNKLTTLVIALMMGGAILTAVLLHVGDSLPRIGGLPGGSTRDLQTLERQINQRRQNLMQVIAQLEASAEQSELVTEPGQPLGGTLLGSERWRPLPPDPPTARVMSPVVSPPRQPEPVVIEEPPPPVIAWGHEYSVSLIYAAERNSFAVVNDQLLGVGDAVDDGVRLVRIERDGVWLSRNGQRQRIALYPDQ